MPGDDVVIAVVVEDANSLVVRHRGDKQVNRLDPVRDAGCASELGLGIERGAEDPRAAGRVWERGQPLLEASEVFARSRRIERLEKKRLAGQDLVIANGLLKPGAVVSSTRT